MTHSGPCYRSSCDGLVDHSSHNSTAVVIVIQKCRQTADRQSDMHDECRPGQTAPCRPAPDVARRDAPRGPIPAVRLTQGTPPLRQQPPPHPLPLLTPHLPHSPQQEPPRYSKANTCHQGDPSNKTIQMHRRPKSHLPEAITTHIHPNGKPPIARSKYHQFEPTYCPGT